MAFGDDIADLFVADNHRFYTGDHLTASARVIGEPKATWQAYDRAWRIIAGTPHDQLGPNWGRQYELRLRTVYELGDKFRVIVKDFRGDRQITSTVPPGGLVDTIIDAYDAGVVALGFTPP